jgi:hypothetical protein
VLIVEAVLLKSWVNCLLLVVKLRLADVFEEGLTFPFQLDSMNLQMSDDEFSIGLNS